MALVDLKSIRDRCEEVGECWIWLQGCSSKGQPSARFKGGSFPVRRKVVEYKLGRPPKPGWFCIAKCGHKQCVSPHCARELSGSQYVNHLNKIGAINTLAHKAAKIAANRRRLGTITVREAMELRARIGAGEDRGVVAADYGVTRNHANHIAAGDCWKGGVPNSSVFCSE